MFLLGVLFVGGFWRSLAFLPFVCLSAGEYFFLAVLDIRVRFWLFRGLAACFTVVCLFYAAVCALCACFRLFPSFICHFIVVWRSPALRLLCAAVSALCPVVFDGVLHFCADRCFSCCFPTLCVFSIVACLFFALFAEFCVFFLMFLFVVGLFFFAPIFLHC